MTASRDAVRQLLPRPHVSALRSDLAIWDAGFREGVCAALDLLEARGHQAAYDELMLEMFGLVRTSAGYAPVEGR